MEAGEGAPVPGCLLEVHIHLCARKKHLDLLPKLTFPATAGRIFVHYYIQVLNQSLYNKIVSDNYSYKITYVMSNCIYVIKISK